MPTYLVETFSPAAGAAEMTAGFAHIGEGRARVRHVRSTFLPEDEICFHLFEAPSREAVCEAFERAGIPYERMSEATEQLPSASGSDPGSDGKPS